MNEFKVGLVLSGGGAKGAYHVGMLKALNELGVQVDAIAGASIGSLNGAVLACAPTLKVGVERLENLWNTLANTPPLKANIPAYFNLLLKAGLHFSGADTAVKILARLGGGALANDGLMSDDPLKELINEYLDETQLAKGIPLFVSVYKGANSLETYMDLAVASLGIKDTQNSKFIHIQSLDRVEQKNALLASAAIPLLFAPKKVNGVTYQDGGIGGWQKMQGNTPITPLLDFGIKNIIVNHLSDGSLWDRHDFPDATVIEIRPKKPIERDGFMDLLGFKPENISSWIKQGYEDTMHCVGRIMEATRAHHEMYQSSLALQDSVKLFSEPNQELEKAKKRLQDLSC